MKIYVKAALSANKFPHFFKESIGSGHAFLGLRRDWREQLGKIRDEAGFKRVRFHGILNDQMTGGGEKLDFKNIGRLYDSILETGMEPFVELSFMPSSLASGKKTVFTYKGNITPPKDLTRWKEAVREFTLFLLKRYGKARVREWFFEIWNEPNLKDFWSGNMTDYFYLYREAAEALKSLNKHIRVGGPATAKNEWIPEFISFCRKEKVPFDFISTHHYPTDTALGFEKDLEEEIMSVKRGVLKEMTLKAKEEAGRYPLFYTEWNSSPGARDHYHDEIYMAPFIIKTVLDAGGLVPIYSFWTFSDIFEETGFPKTPFHGGFGLLTKEGIPKPSYRAFQMLSMLGEKSVDIETSFSPTCQAGAFIKKETFQLIICNHQVPSGKIEDEIIEVNLKGNYKGTGNILRIDSQTTNPKRVWEKIGRPGNLTENQKEKITENSKMKSETIQPSVKSGNSVFKFTLKAHSALLLEFKINL